MIEFFERSRDRLFAFLESARYAIWPIDCFVTGAAVVAARRRGRCCEDGHATGAPLINADRQLLKRCTSCGLPRGTVRHAVICMADICDDPDAGKSA